MEHANNAQVKRTVETRHRVLEIDGIERGALLSVRLNLSEDSTVLLGQRGVLGVTVVEYMMSSLRFKSNNEVATPSLFRAADCVVAVRVLRFS
jgi:hypothetical protein